MPEKVNPREVLAYLNELGYINIDAIQLKEFIRDLKKLMKYEDQKRLRDSRDKIILSRDSKCYDESSTTLQEPSKNEEIANRLYYQATEASKAKIVPAKEHITTIQINRPKSVYVPHIPCTHHEDNKINEAQNIITNNALKEKNIVEEQKVVNSELKKKTKKAEIGKPKGFIRTPVSTNIKSDPVALYHQYQAEWKKWKVPGDDSRSDLRWLIRDKMLRRI